MEYPISFKIYLSRRLDEIRCIGNAELSDKIIDILRKYNIVTLGDLVDLDEKNLLTMEDLDFKSFLELKRFISQIRKDKPILFTPVIRESDDVIEKTINENSGVNSTCETEDNEENISIGNELHEHDNNEKNISKWDEVDKFAENDGLKNNANYNSNTKIPKIDKKSILYDKNTLEEKYEITPKLIDYEMNICSMPFSVRAINCLNRSGISTFGELVHRNAHELFGMQNAGYRTVIEIIEEVKKYGNGQRQNNADTSSNEDYMGVIRNNLDTVLGGDYTFVDISNPQVANVITSIKNAQKDVDKELLDGCIQNPDYFEKVVLAIDGWTEFYNKRRELVKGISHVRLNNKVFPYIEAFVNDKSTYSDLLNTCENREQALKSYISDFRFHQYDNTFFCFLNWCSRNFYEELDEIMKNQKNVDRLMDIVKMRADDKTLEQVGNYFGLTRERIRQMEKKITIKIANWAQNNNICGVISADNNGNGVLTKKMFRDNNDKWGEIVFYVLQNMEIPNCTYNKTYKIYLYGRDSNLDDEETYVENMPETFPKSQLPEYIQDACVQDGITKEQFSIVFKSQYSLNEMSYHRTKVTLMSICDYTIKKYFPFGIHIHDPKEVNDMMQHIHNDFGEIHCSCTQRAIEAMVTRTCILCGRGMYKGKQKLYITENLQNEIYQYIESSQNSVIFIGSIFEQYKPELLEQGIDNHYYLQGVLKELWGNKYYIQRDYISKDPNATGVREQIVDYVRKSEVPVSNEELNKHFPGVTQIIISMSLSEKDILNFWGSYICINKLKLYEYDNRYFKNILDKFVSDGAPHHIKEVYEFVLEDAPEILGRLLIKSRYALYGLMEYMFLDEYHFERPYFAKLGSDMSMPDEQITEYVEENELVKVSYLLELCEECHYIPGQSTIAFLASFNNTHLQISKDELMQIEKTGVDEKIAIEVEKLIKDEINETVAIADLHCTSQFPKICVKWTEYLVYSVMKKWSKELEVSATYNSSYNNAVLLVSPIGKMDNKIVVTRKNLDIIEEKSSPKSNTDFYIWLTETEGVEISTARNYSSAINDCDIYCSEHNIGTGRIYAVDMLDEIEHNIELLTDDTVFQGYNDSQHNRLSAALAKYQKFLGLQEGVVKNQIASTCELEKKEIQDDELARIKDTLEISRFEYGFKDDGVELYRFRISYNEVNGMECALDDTVLLNAIRELGFEFDGKVYLISDSNINIMMNEISEYKAQGINIIYYEQLYDCKLDDFFNAKIVSADMLKALLKHLRPELRYERNYIALPLEKQTESELIRNDIIRVWGDNTLQTFDELSSKLPLIPIDKIKFNLAQQTVFVRNSEETYLQADWFEIDEQEIDRLSDYIDKECEEHGRVSLDEIPFDHIKAANPEFSDTALIKCFCKLVENRFERNLKVLTRKGASKDTYTAVTEFCCSKDKCTYKQLENIAQKVVGTIQQPYIIEAADAAMVRIDRDDFISDKLIHFDVDRIDTALDNIVNDDFIGMREITTFSTFPFCGYSWNLFLLESYCRRFSKKYKYDTRRSNSSNSGAIMVKTCNLSYHDIMVHAVAHSRMDLNQKEVFDFLVETGYMERRRYSDIDLLVNEAAELRERRK